MPPLPDVYDFFYDVNKKAPPDLTMPEGSDSPVCYAPQWDGTL
jgi:hypothetical protein